LRESEQTFKTFGMTRDQDERRRRECATKQQKGCEVGMQHKGQLQKGWKGFFSSPAIKISLGLASGIGLLWLITKFVDIPTTMSVLRQNLATPHGIICALLSGLAFLCAFSIRGIRWKLFLNPVGRISTFKAIQLFLVGIFLNFLLPIRGGEIAKSLMLKRIADIPISQSLPTVAMDKALDLMPALLIMAIVPLLGVQMDIKLWIVLGMVGGLLICLTFFIALAAWKRSSAIELLRRMTGLLPEAIGARIEGFATGFVDALLAEASQPRIFIPATLLTLIAVIFDGLFALLAFWTIGYQIPFGSAILATPSTTCSTSCPHRPARSAAMRPSDCWSSQGYCALIHAQLPPCFSSRIPGPLSS